MMLGLLLARAGVDVTVMEKHADFLRDFRGDTVHASTLRLLDELGLAGQFAQLPHRLIDTARMQLQGQSVDLDLTHLPGAHQHIALVPQWDFLEMLATAAEAEPSFRLMRSTEVIGVIRGSGQDRDRVVGVTYRDESGVKQMRAELTVGCDGRDVGRPLSGRPGAASLRRADGRLVVPAASRSPTTRPDLPARSTPGTEPF